MATAIDSVSPFQAAGAAPGFSKYEKMESSTRHFQGPEIGRIKEWIVMEKIHGANLSLTVWDKGGDEGTGIKIARRNDYLKDGEQFFGLEKQVTLLQNLRRGASKLWDIMNNERTTPIPDSITIYGELFGGYYPHPSVPPQSDITSIQKEVAYCPQLEFSAYDISIANGGDRHYMDYDYAMLLFERAGFMFCRPLAMGSLEEVFNYPLGFLTTIPGTFGLPPIEENLAEGVVVKPLKNSMIMAHKGPRRLIFKRKIEKFSERKALPRPECHLKEERRREDEKWKGEKGETLRYEIFSLITEQRVINAITKLGQPQTKNEWNGVKNELVSDVMETLKEDNEEEWSECDPPTVQMLTNETKKQCGIFIHQYRKQQQQ